MFDVERGHKVRVEITRTQMRRFNVRWVTMTLHPKRQTTKALPGHLITSGSPNHFWVIYAIVVYVVPHPIL